MKTNEDPLNQQQNVMVSVKMFFFVSPVNQVFLMERGRKEGACKTNNQLTHIVCKWTTPPFLSGEIGLMQMRNPLLDRIPPSGFSTTNTASDWLEMWPVN